MKRDYMSRKFLLTVLGVIMFGVIMTIKLLKTGDVSLMESGGVITAMMAQYNLSNAFGNGK